MNRFVLMNCTGKPYAIKYWEFAEGDYRALHLASEKAVEMCDQYGAGYEIWHFIDGKREKLTTYKIKVDFDGERIPT